MNIQCQKQKNGFIALMSVIVLAAVLLILMVSVAAIAFRGRFAVLDYENKKVSFFLAESCLQSAMLELVKNASSTAPLAEKKISVGRSQSEYCRLCKAEPIACPAGHSSYFRCWDIYVRSKYKRGQSGVYYYTNIRSTVGITDISGQDFNFIFWKEDGSGSGYGCIP